MLTSFCVGKELDSSVQAEHKMFKSEMVMFVLLVTAPADLLGTMSFSQISTKIHSILMEYFVSSM